MIRGVKEPLKTFILTPESRMSSVELSADQMVEDLTDGARNLIGEMGNTHKQTADCYVVPSIVNS